MKYAMLVLLSVLAACGSQSAKPTMKSQVAAQELTWKTLRRGDSNREVVAAQYFLRGRGYKVDLNGAFDLKTENAVKDFQKTSEIAVDGVLGPQTWSKLVRMIRLNAEGSSVRALQDQLKYKYGYMVPIDGKFGTSTLNAVKDFQKVVRLEVDGVVGPKTWSTLLTDAKADSIARVQVAKRILNNSTKVVLWQYSPVGSRTTDGADALSNLSDTAKGLLAKTSPNAPSKGKSVALSPRMLQAIEAIANDYKIVVTVVAGGFSPGHYTGMGFNIAYINDLPVVSDTDPNVQKVMKICRDNKAIVVGGPNRTTGENRIYCSFY
jgi:peptidoglycan hydrolase-like protein with peptidoglycan-binding domain